MTDDDNNSDEAQDELRQRFQTHQERDQREESDDGGAAEAAAGFEKEFESPSDDQGREDTTAEPTAEEPEIPYILERATVKEDRTEVRQFFLREDIAAGERDLRNAVEDELGTDVKKLDLREAAYVVAQRHPEEITDVLREWGYKYR